MIGSSKGAPGIEFLIIGAAKVGKTTIAQHMARHFSGAYFNLSIFNRVLAWWTLRSRESNIPFDLYDQERFAENLRALTENLAIHGDGKIFFDSQDVTQEIESRTVSIQASQQSTFVYQNYRHLLKPIEWRIIRELKSQGPVFIVSRSRKSARTARRAVYLDASTDARTERLRISDQSLSLSEAYKIIAERDWREKTFLEKENCDVVIDTSKLSFDETFNAVALEYKKAKLIANMNFYALRPLVALSRPRGEELLNQWVQDNKKFLLCCIDMDNQGKFTNSFGRHVDLLSYFLYILSEIVLELGGIPILWGTDDLLVLFPYDNTPSQAINLMESLRKRYLLKNVRKLGIGVIDSRNGQRCGANMEEIQRLGEFTGYYAGEELFAFEVKSGQSLDDAFNEQLDYINGKLRSANILISGHPKCLVPASTITTGGVLVDSDQVRVKVGDLVDAAYGALQDAKKQGKNSSYFFSPQDLKLGYRYKNQPLIADVHVISEITCQPDSNFPIPEDERREQYPFVHRITALESLVTRWLHNREKSDKFLISLYPGFSGVVIEKMLDTLVAKGEIGASEKAQWMLPHGYRFKALSKIYSQQNRDIFVRASVHYLKTAIANWLERVNKGRQKDERISIANFEGRLLEGLRLSLECFWFFEGKCGDNEAIDLLQTAQSLLTKKLPGFDIKIFGTLVPLETMGNGSEIFTQVNIGSNTVVDSGEQIMDQCGNILLKWRMTEENAQSREQNERKLQALSLEYLNQSQKLGDVKIPRLRD